MSTARFLQTFRKRLRRIRRLAEQPDVLSQKKTPMHRFRVELKRWRAQLRLLRAVDPYFPYPEIYEPFKAVFAPAGVIRFWQLQAVLLQSSLGAPEWFLRVYGDYVQAQIKRARKDFRRSVAEADLPRWRDLKAELEQSTALCTEQTLRQYFQTLQNDLKAQLAHLTRLDAAALHEVRKIVKEYGINRDHAIQFWHFDPGMPPGMPDDHTEIDELLGQWHDLEVASAQLAKDLRSAGWGEAELKGGAVLYQQWKAEESALWERAVAAVQAAGH